MEESTKKFLKAIESGMGRRLKKIVKLEKEFIDFTKLYLDTLDLYIKDACPDVDGYRISVDTYRKDSQIYIRDVDYTASEGKDYQYYISGISEHLGAYNYPSFSEAIKRYVLEYGELESMEYGDIKTVNRNLR